MDWSSSSEQHQSELVTLLQGAPVPRASWFLCRINISLEICELISILLPRQVNKLAVSEAERKDQEESKQDQPIVFGGLPVFFVFSSEAL